LLLIIIPFFIKKFFKKKGGNRTRIRARLSLKPMPLYPSFSAKRSPTSNNPILLCRTITKHSPSLNPLNISNPKIWLYNNAKFQKQRGANFFIRAKSHRTIGKKLIHQKPEPQLFLKP
jgi:hypothetical protein